MGWPAVALTYLSYLALVAWPRPSRRRGRVTLTLAAVAGWIAFAAATALGGTSQPMPTWLAVVAPALVLLAGYRLSGLLFVGPNLRIEAWLREIDDSVLARSGVLTRLQHAPVAVTAYFELSYLLVYAVVPAGAATLALGGHADQIDRYWTTVLAAEFACYGMLPWVQTRPPRMLEAPTRGPGIPALRRLNLGVLGFASIGANTVPSGHAAGALATALAVTSAMPAAGGIFLLLAASITVATVVGRYHYLVDSVLGVLVALIAWWGLR